MKSFSPIWPLLLILSFSLPGTAAFTQTVSFPRGEIIDTIHCLQQPLHSYSLYLPKAYTEDRLWPILFVYDAGGRGLLAVQKMERVAERYGYIIVGSHNFKNGRLDHQIEAVNFLFDDLSLRVKADPKRHYTAGLSGGARIATATATLTQQIAGVIACAAGEQQQFPITANHDFVFISTAGHLDMNRLELELLHQRLDELKFDHKMIRFEGYHAWPPEQVLMKALGWLEVMEMKKERITINEKILEDLVRDEIRQADTMQMKGQLIEAAYLYQDLIKNLNGIYDCKALKQSLQLLQEKPTFSKQQQAERKRLEEEQNEQQQLAITIRRLQGPEVNLATKKLKTYLKQYHKRKTQTNDPISLAMLDRLIGFVSLAAYTLGNQFITAKEYHQATHYYEILQVAHPNQDHLKYRLAQVYARSGKEKKASKIYHQLLQSNYDLPQLKNRKDQIAELLKTPF